MYQMGTYIHFVLTLLVFNVKRKDFTVLFIHHIVTLCLLVWSFAVRCVCVYVCMCVCGGGGGLHR